MGSGSGGPSNCVNGCAPTTAMALAACGNVGDTVTGGDTGGDTWPTATGSYNGLTCPPVPPNSAYAQPGLAPTGLALRRVLRNLLLGSRNRSKIHPKSIGLLIVFVS